MKAIFIQMLLLGFVAFAAKGADDLHLVCISDMLLPSYGPIALKAKNTGSVRATVLLKPNGSIDRLDLQGDKWLCDEVELFLRTYTQYTPNCAGTLRLVFTFVLRPNKERNPRTVVKFKGPNEFVLESARPEPIIN